MKKIEIGCLIFALIMLYSCKDAQKENNNKETKPEVEATKTNDLKIDKSLIVGSWIDTAESALNFTLFDDGTARSDNMATLIYKNWQVNSNNIIFTIESIGNGTSSIDDEMFEIQKLDENEMILKSGNRLFTYKKSNEKFEIINTDELTKKLTESNKNISAKEVMKLYYPTEKETGEGNEIIEISEKIGDDGNTIVTLIHDNLLDDSIKGEKYILELKRENDKWIIISLKKNWKCQHGRGHTEWGIEVCSRQK